MLRLLFLIVRNVSLSHRSEVSRVDSGKRLLKGAFLYTTLRSVNMTAMLMVKYGWVRFNLWQERLYRVYCIYWQCKAPIWFLIKIAQTERKESGVHDAMPLCWAQDSYWLLTAAGDQQPAEVPGYDCPADTETPSQKVLIIWTPLKGVLHNFLVKASISSII